MSSENKLNLVEMAKRAGLYIIRCPACGEQMSGMEALQRFFENIIEAIKLGSEVSIWGFGRFRATKIKGRRMETPLMSGGSVKFKDCLVLRFHQYKMAKEKLNR